MGRNHFHLQSNARSHFQRDEEPSFIIRVRLAKIDVNSSFLGLEVTLKLVSGGARTRDVCDPAVNDEIRAFVGECLARIAGERLK